MGLNGGFVRCVKHPSHLSLGFCSLCLVDRLTNVGLTKEKIDPIDDSECEILEVSIATPKLEEKKEKPKTTLLALFELDDFRSNTTEPEVESTGLNGETVAVKYQINWLKWRKHGAPLKKKEPHTNCSMESPREMQLKRSSSLRCACEWIACCNNCDSTNSLCKNWNKLWDGGTIFPLGLKRSLSEAGKDQKLFGDQIAQKIVNDNMNNQRLDLHKKKCLLGRSFSLRSAISSSPNKSKNGFIKFYLPFLKTSMKRANDDDGSCMKNERVIRELIRC